MSCGEFELITRYFDRKTAVRDDVEQGIGDDCALLHIPQNRTLAVSVDTLVEGVHFLPEMDPADLGHKALAVNLSDLAAMGADPAWLTLALTLPAVDECWLRSFSDALFALLDEYKMQLVGGDTTRGPRSLTLAVHGFVPDGCALRRCGGQPGDSVYVSGTLGDSAAGLVLLQQRVDPVDAAAQQWLINRHLRPAPRIWLGQALRTVASAAVDLSDGLIADLGHILRASQCGVTLELDALPLSAALREHFDHSQALRWALAGGEDYELCFTVPDCHRDALKRIFDRAEVACTCIGRLTPVAEGVLLQHNGVPVEFNLKGFEHFGA